MRKTILLYFCFVLYSGHWSCIRVTQANQPQNKRPTLTFPWIIKPTIIVFSFEGLNADSIRKYYKEGDPLNLLNRTFPSDTARLCIKQFKRLNDDERKRFYDSCCIDNHIDEVYSADCGFNPHHVFIYMNDSMEVLSYELVCFWCSERKVYGKKLNYKGEYLQLFRFCQFNGLDFSFGGPETIYEFGTEDEKKCQRLRKFPTEKINCKEDYRIKNN